MTISDYIQKIVNECWPGISYKYGRNTDFNITGDNTPSPAVVCIEADQQFLNISSLTGNVNDGYNLFIRFIQTMPAISEMADTRVDVINQQKVNAAQFITQLSGEEDFNPLTSPIPVVPVIEAYDGNWFGVEINLRNLTLTYPLPVCYIEPVINQ